MGWPRNYGMAFIESIIAALILYLVSSMINKQIPEDKQIPRIQHKRCTAVVALIMLGISFGVRCIFETLRYFNDFFTIFVTDFFMFGLMCTIYFFIYKKLIFKFAPLTKEQLSQSHFLRIFMYFIILIWIIAVIFIPIPLLGIELSDTDVIVSVVDISIFEVGFYWAAFAVIFDMGITKMINRLIPIDKRIPKEPLKYAMFSGGLISFGLWSIQLIIVELYLKRAFLITVYEQDIRVLLVFIALIYSIVFSLSLIKRFLPRAKIKSKDRVQKALSTIEEEKTSSMELDSSISKRAGDAILKVRDLTTYFYTEEGIVRALEDVSFNIFKGEVLGLVGETGCGKSVSALSILRLIRPPGKIEKGTVEFDRKDLLKISELEMLKYRGKDITMIFQDPLNSLNPVFKIGKQISEVFLLHMQDELLAEASSDAGVSIYSLARKWCINLLKDLNIPHPEIIIDRYPHELSGGMRQRVQIAMGLACRPKLLIADEPTTALDVTIQNQILKLMKDLHTKYKTTILFISHDLGIISKMCDHVGVMYSGSIVEYGKIQTIFAKPFHPYTKGLINSIPVVGKIQERLSVIPGSVPNLIYPPSGCRFHPRCQYCFEPCDSKVPKKIEMEPEHYVACHLYDPQYKDLADKSINNVENMQ